jgi:hypothetical protein
MMKFLALSPALQHAELRKWMHFYLEISPAEYAKLMADFKESLRADKTNNVWQTKIKGTDGFKDWDTYRRKLLFEKILDSKDKITEIYMTKKVRQQEILSENYRDLVRKLIDGTNVTFTNESKSHVLEDTLVDLRGLESELKIAVSGEPLTSKSYETLLEKLKESPEKPVDNDATPGADDSLDLDKGQDDKSGYMVHVLAQVSTLLADNLITEGYMVHALAQVSTLLAYNVITEDKASVWPCNFKYFKDEVQH